MPTKGDVEDVRRLLGERGLSRHPAIASEIVGLQARSGGQGEGFTHSVTRRRSSLRGCNLAPRRGRFWTG